ncbi:hypothetical protein D3C71_1578270 [compost metagenome]
MSSGEDQGYVGLDAFLRQLIAGFQAIFCHRQLDYDVGAPFSDFQRFFEHFGRFQADNLGTDRTGDDFNDFLDDILEESAFLCDK